MGQLKARRRATAVAISALLLAGAGVPSAAMAAEVRRGADYVAIVVEAEDGTGRDERWILTDPSTPAQENDPDPNHTDTASGGEYLELLPDIRIKHGDPFKPPQAFWPQPGTGPRASYAVDFPEPGRYYVHARVFATGSEDNGIHFGLDGQWPDTAKALQACTASQRAWRWSSRRRHIGGYPCGVENTIWLTVDTAGTHTVMISAREDGFELDRFMLIKDLSEGTRTCMPAMTRADDIVCRNGGIEVSDDRVDLELELGFYVETEIEVEDKETGEIETEIEITLEEKLDKALTVGDTVEIGVRVKNDDIYDDATDTVVDLELAEGDWKLVGSNRNCGRDGDTVSCALGKVRPTGINDGSVVSLTLEALSGGLLPVGASVFAEQEDEKADNDAERMNVEVELDVEPTELTVDVASRRTGARVVGEESATVDATVRNTGDVEALDVVLTFELAEGLSVGDVPAGCELAAADEPVTCNIGTLDAGDSQRVSIGVAAEEDGAYLVETSASGANAVETDARVRLEFVETTGDGSTTGGGADDSGDGDDSGSGSGEDGAGDGSGGSDTSGDTSGGATDAGSDGASDGETGSDGSSGSEAPVTKSSSDGKSGGGVAGGFGLLALTLLATRRRRRAAG